jgi:sterol desaturase/sphingolipid hydroxylase (fatty acid hydroxylase superfamily)
VLIGSGLWDGRKHYLDKMTLGDLVRAYAAYPAIQAYVVLALIAAGAVIAQWPAPVGGVAAAVVATIAVYPLIWYLLHRYVLHGRYLYKWVGTAAMWKRIHYDHHQDPNDLGVLFGALYTTLPTITLVTLPVGWLLAGPAGSAAAFGTGMVVTCFYEFCHCIQHLAYAPKWGFVRRIKKLHLLHHFHSEKGNYGITNYTIDRLLGTFYGDTAAMARSDTVSNLGYAESERERYPWVKNLSTGDVVAGDIVDKN